MNQHYRKNKTGVYRIHCTGNKRDYIGSAVKHGRMTKDKLAEQRRLADEGRILKVRLKRIEDLLIDAGLMPED